MKGNQWSCMDMNFCPRPWYVDRMNEWEMEWEKIQSEETKGDDDDGEE